MATTLGAAIHELGHVFDLAHSEDGFMARGFDDLDKFFKCSSQSANNSITMRSHHSIKEESVKTMADVAHCKVIIGAGSPSLGIFWFQIRGTAGEKFNSA